MMEGTASGMIPPLKCTRKLPAEVNPKTIRPLDLDAFISFT